jgi:hypothetical protein
MSEKRLDLWRLAFRFVLGFVLSAFLTLLLMASPDAASSSPVVTIGTLILAALCVLGWWLTFRAGRGILRLLRRARA